jgi:DNA-binding FadR family transcriptional regulator
MRRYPDRGLHGRAVEDLGRRIVSGELAEDAPIDIDELSERYDSSRGVVREALRVLGAKGLIDARPKRGTYVTPRSSWSLLDNDVLRWQFEMLPSADVLERLAELRLIIEPGAAALAARHRTEADLAELAAALDALEITHETDEAREAAVVGDIRFHTAILHATHNDLVDQLAVVIEIGLKARDELVYRTPRDYHRGFAQHAAVAEAIRAGDPRAAQEAMLALAEDAAKDAREAVATAHRAARS